MKISGRREDIDVIDVEKELRRRQNKKLKKHYLKPTAKAFVYKFKKILKGE